jgi:cell division protein FtsI (penicillin-binding protein 3)
LSTFLESDEVRTVFNNNGQIVTPYLTGNNSLKNSSKQIISVKTSNLMKKLLIDTVVEGTGKSAFINGLEIGGKTGTAQVARKGAYQKEYVSSFFGFANDKNQSYTIGVTVFNPNSKGKKYYQYYASQSAVPVFKEVLEILVKLRLLVKED